MIFFNIENIDSVRVVNNDEVIHYNYLNDAIQLKFALNKTKNDLELLLFYRKQYKTNKETKGYGLQILKCMIQYFIENNLINDNTVFKLETENLPSKRILKYYNKIGFRKYDKWVSERYDGYFIRMKQTIMKFKQKNNLI
jgi:hypothetical protein